MRSKNWSFKLSWPLIRKDFTRFWPVWGSYLAIWLLILPIPLLVSGFEEYGFLTMVEDIQRFLLDLAGSASLVMSAIYGGLAAFAVWSYLYQSRSASLFHALPVTRETLFVSHFTAGLGFLVVPNVLIALLTWLCQAALGYFDPSYLLLWLLVSCLNGLLFFAIGTLAAHMTGSLPAMPVLYGLLNFAVVVCETLLHEYATMLYFGITSLELRLTAFSPFVHLVNLDLSMALPGDGRATTYVFNPDYLKVQLLYALVAVALAVLSMVFYRKRTTESAGDVIALPWLKPVAKYVFSFGCALTLGWLLLEIVFSGSENAVAIFISLIVAGTVGYLTAAMLLKKSFRVFTRKQLAGLPVLWLVLALIICCFRFDLLGTERYIPDVDDLRSAELSSQYNLTADAKDPAGLAAITDLHQAIMAERDVLKPFDYERYGEWITVRLYYTLHNGREISRRYYIPYTTEAAKDPSTVVGKVAVLMDDPMLILKECLPPENAVIESLSLSVGEGLEKYASPLWQYDRSLFVDTAHIPVLRQALKEDILAGRLARWHQDYKFNGGEILCGFEFSYEADETVYLNLDPNSIGLESSPYTSRASRWCSIYLYDYDNPTATLEALYKLGYLTEVPHD